MRVRDMRVGDVRVRDMRVRDARKAHGAPGACALRDEQGRIRSPGAWAAKQQCRTEAPTT